MARKPARTPHHIKHVRHEVSVPLGEMTPGQVFMREGAPHMAIDVSKPGQRQGRLAAPEGTRWAVNLLTGSAWTATGDQAVIPAIDIELEFKAQGSRT